MTVNELVAALYQGLAAGDRQAVGDLLHPDFEGTFTESLPFGIGGTHSGADAAIDGGWWAIGREFALRAIPSEWIECVDGRLLVVGRYAGHVRSTGAPVDAAFAHLWTARDGRLAALWQLTDSTRWKES